MSNDVKAWMEAYKLNLMNQIEILRNRISLVNAMLLEFDGSAPPGVSLDEAPKGYTVKVKAAAKPKRKRKSGRPADTSKTTPLVVVALEAAGASGATAREVAGVAQIPIGTASSRLSLLARDGRVTHDPSSHRYFAIHSTREDNNLEA
jgi:hypothetical protein